MIRIEANSLHRLCYNALLFDTKSAKAFSVYGTTMKMNTSDGQVYLEDVAELLDPEANLHQWIMGAEWVKALEGDLRKIDDDLGITISKDGFEVHRFEGEPYPISYGEYAQQSGLFESVVGDGGPSFSINPDRLRKLALLQPRDYPVKMEICSVDGIDTDVLLFTKGPTVRGAYATLDVEVS